MTLRVRARGCDERIVHIQSAKCTIGSAPGCTLRVHAQGVGPLHCWILRGSAGTVVRRLHGLTTLNDSRFDESLLKTGDRLRIGTVELEIVECNQPLPPPALLFNPARSASGDIQEAAELKAELAAMKEQNLRLEGEARQGFQASITAAERADQLRDALAAAHQQLEQACRELAATQQTISRQSEQLAAQQAQLNALRCETATQVAVEVEQACRASAEAAERQAALEGEVEQARRELAAAVEQRAQLKAELEQARREASENQEHRSALEMDLQRARSELAAATDQRGRLEVELEQSRRESLEASEQRARLQADADQAERDAAEARQQRARLQEEVERARRESGEALQQRGRLEADVDQARRSAKEASEQRSRLESELEHARSLLSSEAQRWEEAQRLLERRLEQRDAEIAALRSAGSGQTNPMTVMMNEIEQGKNAASEAPAEKPTELQQRLAAQQSEIESLKRIVGEQTIIEGRFEKLTRDYDVRCIELDEARSQLAAATAASSRARDEAEERNEALTRWQEELAGREARLAEAQEKLATERERALAESQTFEADRQQARSEHEELNRLRGELESARQQLQADQAEVASQRAQLAIEREQLASLQQGLQGDRQSQLEQHSSEVERQLAAAVARLAEFEQLREQLTVEREALEARCNELDEREHELATRAQDMDARSSVLEGLRQDINHQAAVLARQQTALNQEIAAVESDGPAVAQQVSEKLAAAEAACERLSAGPAMCEANAALNVTCSWPAPPPPLSDEGTSAMGAANDNLPPGKPPLDLDFEPPAAAQGNDPGNVDSVLSRLVTAGTWRKLKRREAAPKNSAAASGKSDSAAPGGTLDSPAAAPPVKVLDATSEAIPAAERRSTPVRGDEESIESYMERLLKRVKGDSAVLPSSQPKGVQPLVDPPVQQPAVEAQHEEIDSVHTSSTPGTDLTAMRVLADAAARSEIDRRVRQQAGRQVVGKVFGAVVMVTASGLLSYWAWKTGSRQATVEAAICGVAGAYWTFAAIRRLLTTMRLNAE